MSIMDVKAKNSERRKGSDNFLFDAVKPRPKRFSVGDGFRLGVGFIIGQLLVVSVVAGLAWAIVVGFKLK